MRKILVFWLLMAFAPITAIGEEGKDVVKVKEVVITATKTEQELEDVPASVTVITKQEIEAKGAKKLRDIINFAVGVYKQRFMVREDSEVSIRGFKPEQTLILIDGKRFTGEVSHAYEIDRLTLENVERIEIVRGPVSALYGTDALGGVINIITKPSEKFSFEFTPEYGFFGGVKGEQRSYSARLDTGKIGNFGFTLSGSLINRNPLINQNGAYTVGDAEHKNLALKGTYDFTKNTRLAFDAEYMKEDSIDKSLSRTTLFRYIDDNVRYNFSLGLSHKSPELDYLLRAYTSIYDKDHEARTDGTGALTDFTEAERRTSVVEGKITKELFKNHLTTFGMEYRNEFFKGTRLKTGKGTYSVTREGITLTGSEAKLNYWAGYMQDEWQAFDNLILVPAIRYDDSDEFEGKLSPKVGVTYKVLPNLRVKASYGHGFKSPTPRELYYDFSHSGPRYRILGNPDVKPEKANSYEIAVEAEKGIFSGRASYFYNDVEDLITTTQVTCPAGTPAGWRCFQYKNVSKAEIQGIELEAGARLTKALSLNASYAYLDAKDKDTGQRLQGRTRNKIVAKANYENKAAGFKASLWWEYIDGLLYQTNPDIEKEYGIGYLSLSKELTKNFELYAGIDNIFNKKDNDIPIAGAFYYGGVRMRF